MFRYIIQLNQYNKVCTKQMIQCKQMQLRAIKSDKQLLRQRSVKQYQATQVSLKIDGSSSIMHYNGWWWEDSQQWQGKLQHNAQCQYFNQFQSNYHDGMNRSRHNIPLIVSTNKLSLVKRQAKQSIGQSKKSGQKLSSVSKGNAIFSHRLNRQPMSPIRQKLSSISKNQLTKASPTTSTKRVIKRSDSFKAAIEKSQEKKIKLLHQKQNKPPNNTQNVTKSVSQHLNRQYYSQHCDNPKQQRRKQQAQNAINNSLRVIQNPIQRTIMAPSSTTQVTQRDRRCYQYQQQPGLSFPMHNSLVQQQAVNNSHMLNDIQESMNMQPF